MPGIVLRSAKETLRILSKKNDPKVIWIIFCTIHLLILTKSGDVNVIHYRERFIHHTPVGGSRRLLLSPWGERTTGRCCNYPAW